MKRKFLSILLTVCMVIGTFGKLGTVSFAMERAEEPQEVIQVEQPKEVVKDDDLGTTKQATTLSADYVMVFDAANGKFYKGTINKTNGGVDYGDSKGYVPAGGWTISGYTLTLTNFHFTTSEPTCLIVPKGTKLVLVGQNSLTSTYSGTVDAAAVEYDTLDGLTGTGTEFLITGSGSLTIKAGSCSGKLSSGISSSEGKKLVIDQGTTVSITAGKTTGTDSRSAAIYMKDVDVKGHLTAIGGNSSGESSGIALMDGGSLSVSGTLTAKGGAAKTGSFGIDANLGDSVNVTGTISASAGTGCDSSNSLAVGIYAKKLTVQNGAQVTATSEIGSVCAKDTYGILATSSLESSGTIVATAGMAQKTAQAIRVEGTKGNTALNITDGSVTATGGKLTKSEDGSFTSGISILNGTMMISGTNTVVNATGGAATASNYISAGLILAENDKLIMNGGTVNFRGGDGSVKNSAGIYIYGGTLEVSGGTLNTYGGAVQANGISTGIEAQTDVGAVSLSLKGGTLNAKGSTGTGANSVSSGLYLVADKNNITLTASSGTFTAEGATTNGTNGFSAGAYIIAKNSKTVTTTFSGATATFSGGNTTGEAATSAGILAGCSTGKYSIVMQKGSLTATGGNTTGKSALSCGIVATASTASDFSLSESGGSLTAIGGTTSGANSLSAGIYASMSKVSTLNISGGTLFAQGGETKCTTFTSGDDVNSYGIGYTKIKVTSTGGNLQAYGGKVAYSGAYSFGLMGSTDNTAPLTVNGGSVGVYGGTASKSLGLYAKLILQSGVFYAKGDTYALYTPYVDTPPSGMSLLGQYNGSFYNYVTTLASQTTEETKKQYNSLFTIVKTSGASYKLTIYAEGDDKAPLEYTGIEAGAEVTLTAYPASGETFDHWECDVSQSVFDDPTKSTVKFTMPASDAVIRFVCIKKAYAVTYELNGGSNGPETQIKIHNTDLVLSYQQPTKEGFTFKGWSTEPDGSGTIYQPGATYKLNRPVALYAIWAKVLTDSMVQTINDQEYTGKPIAPIVVKDGGTELKLNQDYSVVYNNNTDLGVADALITGIGKYDGTIRAYFNIIGNLSAATIGTIADQTYTGSACEPTISVTFAGKTLTKGTDYSVSYENSGKPGLATVKITGLSSFIGTKTATYKIMGNLNEAVIGSISNQTYTGSALEPSLSVTCQGLTLTKDTDYTATYTDNTLPGTATVKITGTYYTGEKTTQFKITGDLKNAVVASVANQTVTGTAITPEPQVTFGGKILTKDVDYSLSYTDNVNPGTATILITGLDAYVGTSTSKKFTIVGKSITGVNVSSIEEQTFTGSEIKPEITVTDESTPLTVNVDYTLSYTDNVHAGTATITITGIGNYGGEKKVTFSITAADISLATVDPINDQKTTGSEIKPTPNVMFGGATLVSGTDFSVTYQNNVAIGEATITITGIGDFTGEKEVKFNIVAKPFVAQVVGGEKYYSIKEAIDAVGKTKSTIKMIGDDSQAFNVNSDCDITLDLNGMSLNIKTKNIIAFNIGGNLTIIDSSLSKSGTIKVVNSEDWRGEYLSMFAVNYGKLYLNGGTYLMENYNKGYCYAISVEQSGLAVIIDASIEITDNSVQGGSSVLTIRENSTNNSKAYIYGGTYRINSPHSASRLFQSRQANQPICVWGGTFYGKTVLKDINDNIKIYGGKYTVAPSGEYIAGGYIIDISQLYVDCLSPRAKVTSGEYTYSFVTLSEAINLANFLDQYRTEKSKITVVENVDEALIIPVGTSTKIDASKRKITGSFLTVKGTLEVTGGELNISHLTIDGGTLILKDCKVHGTITKNSGVCELEDGIYQNRPDDSLLKEGYAVVANADPNTSKTYPYTIIEKAEITFQGNGGQVESKDSVTKSTNTSGKFDTLPTPTIKGCFEFVGWYTAVEGGELISSATVFTEDKTLYARWNAINHTLGSWTSNGDGTHSKTCTIEGCSEKETENCSGGTATCIKKALCEVCSQEYGDVDGLNHSALQHMAKKAATETADGHKEFWYCADCKKYFADAKGAVEKSASYFVLKYVAPTEPTTEEETTEEETTVEETTEEETTEEETSETTEVETTEEVTEETSTEDDGEEAKQEKLFWTIIITSGICLAATILFLIVFKNRKRKKSNQSFDD